MLLLSLLLATHVPSSDYLKCEDFEWLSKGLLESTVFSPSEKVTLIFRWMDHTDPVCFGLVDTKEV